MKSLHVVIPRQSAAALLALFALCPHLAAAQAVVCPPPGGPTQPIPAGCQAQPPTQGGEVSMIELQQVVAARQNALNRTTTMMKSINDSQSEIAKNIGR